MDRELFLFAHTVSKMSYICIYSILCIVFFLFLQFNVQKSTLPGNSGINTSSDPKMLSSYPSFLSLYIYYIASDCLNVQVHYDNDKLKTVICNKMYFVSDSKI